MTSFGCTSFTSLSTTCALAALLTLGACGGGDDAVTVVDASPDAEIDAPIDAPPLVCNPPTMNCGGQCVNTNTDEQFCGNCNTVCNGGRTCQTGECMCPANVTVPTTVPAGLPSLAIAAQGVLIGSSNFSGNALVAVVDPVNTVLDQEYTLSEASLGSLPLAGFAINLNLQAMTADATYAATEGTLTITDICPGSGNTFPPDGRLVGTLTNVKFSAVDGLLTGNPVITPGGCTIPPTGTIDSISFTFGETSCMPAAR